MTEANKNSNLDPRTAEKFGGKTFGAGEKAPVPNRSETVAPELKKADPKYKMEMNLSHSTALLQGLGLLAPGEQFEYVQDPIKLGKIEKKFKILYKPVDSSKPEGAKEPNGLEITGKNINSFFQPDLVTQVREALSKETKKRRVDSIPVFLKYLIEEIRQSVNISNNLLVLNRASELPDDDQGRERLNKNIRRFIDNNLTIRADVKLLESMIATMKALGSDQSAINNAGDGLKEFESQLKDIDAFLANAEKIDAIIKKSGQAYPDFPRAEVNPAQANMPGQTPTAA